ncbi:SusE domain-containing protein [Hymenobacter jeollabukensis]|uniref:SusE outer membrane protein domain-containing protein n=1 Tax=Hymenobacter jeollabukensis TaxID=2025313 RepID=A0A5R8WXF5_9BACT|nr:SusE domain-containing protein [Hymenobacter jeollabukensis]TLM96912.1 hypothetical protein FDY95_02650 [Hymenobacter jeollabukensis]
MKKWFLQAAVVCALGFGFTACDKDEDRATLKVGNMPTLTATATSATLTPANASQAGVTFSWTPAEFGYQAAVTYTLEFAKAGTNFANAKAFPLTTLTKSFTKGELNQVYNDLDCNLPAAPPATPLDVRVRASIGDKVDPSMSQVLAFTATPYQAQQAPTDRWGIIGDATPTGWGSDSDMNYDFCSGTYKISNIALSASGKFKFRANDDWALNFGGTAAASANTPSPTLVGGGPDISVPSGSGNYDISLNVAAKTFTWSKRP